MEQAVTTPNGSRRNEDIALDLLKFVPALTARLRRRKSRVSPPSRVPMSSEKTLSVAVFGVGAFGRNHLRIFRQLEQSGAGVRLAAIVDTDPGSARKLREEEGLAVFSSPEECLQPCL